MIFQIKQSYYKKDEISFLNLLSNKTNYKNQKIITIHFRDSLYKNDPNRRSYRIHQ